MRSIRLLPLSLLALLPTFTLASDDPPRPDGPLTKALKRMPADRQGPIIDMIGKRGTSADLDYLFDQALFPEGFKPAARLKALEALAEAAQTRETLPSEHPERLASLIETSTDPAVRRLALKLAGLWKVQSLTKTLRMLAGSPRTEEALRSSAFEALASVGGDDAREAISALTDAKLAPIIRAMAIAALARLDVDQAAPVAATFLRDPGNLRDLTPLISAFLNRRGGADKLASEIDKAKIPADPARLALHAVFELGHSDPALVTALTRAAGLDAAVKPLDKAAMDRMIADVGSLGNAERGERIFRRADLACTKCHALSGAGGGVGPDLSPIGATSPVDYLVNSIMLPDLAIKEEFQTLVVQTVDGQVFQGIVADKDDKRIVLKEATGSLRTVATADIEESKEGGSLMPKGLVNFLSRADFIDLVRFLSEMGKPGPYAIRSTPTIQRWRVLKSAPSASEAEVMKTDPSQWAPAYAKLAGDLPLSELTAEASSPVLYLQADVDVTHADKVKVQLNSSEGVTAWVDAQPIPFSGSSFQTDLSTGRHTLTFRIDSKTRKTSSLRAEVLKPEGSSAEYTVVGGR